MSKLSLLKQANVCKLSHKVSENTNARIDTLRVLARQFRDIGQFDLCKKILIVLAVATGGSEPRPDLSYSYIMRQLRKADNNERLKQFINVFKKAFDDAVESELDSPDQLALLEAIKAIDFGSEESDDAE